MLKFLYVLLISFALLISGCSQKVHTYTYNHSVLSQPDYTKTLQEVENSEKKADRSSSVFSYRLKNFFYTTAYLGLVVGILIWASKQADKQQYANQYR